MTLGHGESVDGDVYTFEAHLGSAGHTDARPLDHWRGAYFNTHRFCMSKGCEIVYRHSLAGRRLLSGEIGFGASTGEVRSPPRRRATEKRGPVSTR